MEPLSITQLALRLVFALAVVIWGWYTPPLQQLATGIAGGVLLLTAVKPNSRLAVCLDVLAVSLLQVYSPMWLPLGAWAMAVHRRYARSVAVLLIPALVIRAWRVNGDFLWWAILFGVLWLYLGFSLAERQTEEEEDERFVLPLPDDLREQWEQEREAHRQLRYQYQELVGAHRHLQAQRRVDQTCLQILRIGIAVGEPREAARQIVAVLREATSAADGAIWFFGEHPPVLRLAYPADSPNLPSVITMPSKQDKRFLQVASERLHDALSAQGQSATAFLLQDGKDVVGAVALYGWQGESEEPAVRERLQQLRDSLALAVRLALQRHALQGENQMLKAQYEIGRLLIEPQSVEDSVKKLITSVADLLPAAFVTLYLRAPDTDTFQVSAYVGEPIRLTDNEQTETEAGVLSWFIQRAQPLYLPYTSAEPGLIRYASKRVFASLIGAPILVRERLEGVLLASHSQPGYFDAQQLENLVAIARQFAQVLEVSRLTRSVGLLALTDGLTGLFNRRYLDLRLEEEIRRGQRYGKCFTLILVDVDHFKRVNDTWGHATGDLVLQTVGRILTDNLRETEMVFRFGGEELLILLPETPLQQAVEVARRLCGAVANHPFRTVDGASTFQVTLSAGVAEYPTHGSDKLTLLSAVDHALYLAKRRGRNRVELSPAA